MHGPVNNADMIVPIPNIPPSVKPIIKKLTSSAIRIQRYSNLVLSFIIKGIISFGATPRLVADSIENPIAIRTQPNITKSIFTTIFKDAIGKNETALTPRSIIGTYSDHTYNCSYLYTSSFN